MTVMLATASKEIAATADETVARLQDRGWLFDVKWDGVRMVATIDDGQVTLVNRNLRTVTWKYPDVVAWLADLFPNDRWVLDGEIVAFDDDGKPSFQRVARRDQVEAQREVARAAAAQPVAYVCFDVLEAAGVPLRSNPLRERLEVLRRLGAHGLTVSSWSTDGAAIWDTVQKMGIEGLIAKDPLAPYRTGRSSAWVKVKVTQRATFTSAAYELGSGRLADGLGALYLDLHDGTDWVRVGKVGTGFSDAERAELQRQLDDGHRLVVEVEFAGTTDSGTPRFPSYKGLRSDVLPEHCTTDQL